MKQTNGPAKAAPPAPSQAVLGKAEITQDQGSNLSPTRVNKGASDTTLLYRQLTEQRERLRQVRDRGLNE